jgi:hypothetical protein
MYTRAPPGKMAPSRQPARPELINFVTFHDASPQILGPNDSSFTITGSRYLAQYEGTALSNGITQWLGMRFAAPPVGDLRFAPPQDPPFQEGITAADHVCVSFRPGEITNAGSTAWYASQRATNQTTTRPARTVCFSMSTLHPMLLQIQNSPSTSSFREEGLIQTQMLITTAAVSSRREIIKSSLSLSIIELDHTDSSQAQRLSIHPHQLPTTA